MYKSLIAISSILILPGCSETNFLENISLSAYLANISIFLFIIIYALGAIHAVLFRIHHELKKSNLENSVENGINRILYRLENIEEKLHDLNPRNTSIDDDTNDE